MAAKKNMEPEEVAMEQEKKPDTVKIKLPRLTKNDSDVFVSVNNQTYLIKRGVEVEVPKKVAHVIELSERMKEEAYEYNSGVQTN